MPSKHVCQRIFRRTRLRDGHRCHAARSAVNVAPMQTTVVWEVIARQQRDFADARKRLVETRFPKLGFNLVRGLPLPPFPSADSVAFGPSTGRSQRLLPSSKPLRPDTSQYCFRRHFKGSPSSDRAYGRQRTHLSARLGALAFADACTATTASWLTLSPRQ
jgi:hypothetical protein